MYPQLSIHPLAHQVPVDQSSPLQDVTWLKKKYILVAQVRPYWMQTTLSGTNRFYDFCLSYSRL